MKRWNKLLVFVLVFMMIVPVVTALAPMEANAATATEHLVYRNEFDFEDTKVGEKLTSDYLNTKVESGFSTTIRSSVDTKAARYPENYTVVSETVNGVTNNYIKPTVTPSMPTIYDETGRIWKQPYEISFNIKGEKGSSYLEYTTSDGKATNNNNAYTNGALIAVAKNITASSGNRASLLYARNLDVCWGAGSSNKVCTLAKDQWHRVTALINPLTGEIKLTVEQLTFDEAGTKMTKGSYGTANAAGTLITSSTTVATLVTFADANPTAGLISLGRFYGDAVVDFCFDDIVLGSYIDEHIDFTDAQIEAIPEVTETQTLAAYLNANDKTLTSGISQFTDSAGTSCFELAKDGDNWVMRQDVASTAKANASTAGLNFKDTTNLTNKDTVTITFDFRRNADGMPGGYNTVRTYGGTTMGPLTFRNGQYITTNASGYATFRKTDEGYVQGTIAKGVWYSFKVELDMPNTKMKVWMKEGTANGPSTSDWEPVYYLTNGTANGVAGGTLVQASTAAQNTYTLADYESIMTTDADLKWYNGSSAAFGATPQLWFLHGTNDAWGNGAKADMDNLTIKTADGNLDVSFDFTPEITVVSPAVPENTDWWENDTFENADAKKGGAKLSDFQVVDTATAQTYTVYNSDGTTSAVTVTPDATGAHGSAIRPKGTLGSFCFNDTKDLLTNYIFDVSYDFYMAAQPSSNILMLKLWAPYTANDTTASDNNAVFNTLVVEGGYFKIFDTTISGNLKYTDVKLAANTKTWYNVRIRMDLVSGYYWVYIDDVLIHTQDILSVYPSLNLEAMHNIHFGIHSHWGAAVKAYHLLDNIRVRTVDIPEFENNPAELVGVQQSKNSNSIRVIAGVDSLRYSNVGFTFELLADDGSGWVKVDDQMTNMVYTQITADGETVTAEDEGCRYFIMAIISDITTDGILCIRPYTTKDYVRNYGEEAVYMLKVDDGSLSMQPTTISTTSTSPDYVVYAEESFEKAKDIFSNYSSTPNASDTGEYRLGGEMKTNLIPVGATVGNARTGIKSMTIDGLAPHSSGNLSARIKLNNFMPFDIANYQDYDVKISAYVKLDDVFKPANAVNIRFGLMGEKNNTELVYATTPVYEGQWTLIEYEGRITEDLLTKLGTTDGGVQYPARVFIGLGSPANYAATVHVDDIKVEMKPSVGVTVPSIFADGMVIQRNKPVNVWGWDGLAGDKITATVTGANGELIATGSATVDSKGEFTVALPAMAGSAGNTLTVTNETVGSSLEYTDVGIGEVLYCSGQSNMELSMNRTHNTTDIVADASNRDIRSFKMSRVAKYTLQKDVVGGTWKQLTSSNVGSASAIAYVTAYHLQKELNVPVAIIESHWGSTSANSWLSYDKVFAADRAEIYNNKDWIPKNEDGSIMTASSGGLEGKTMHEDYNYYWQVGTANEGTVRKGEYGNNGSVFAPTGLYNGMQGPLAGFSVAGVLWYQGESRTNSLRPEEYNYVLYDLIEQWREDFCDEELPVVIFQLAPYSEYYNEIRQTQLDTAKRDAHVYAITTATEGAIYSKASGGSCLDLDRSTGNDGTQSGGNAIHPGSKIPVATRAANTLLANEYGVTSYASLLNPEYQSMTVNGNVVTLTFSDANGLKIHSGDAALEGFRALDASGTELTVVSAVINGDTVVVTTEAGTTPAVVTYGWLVSSTRREINYPDIELNGTEYATQYINVMEGNLENAVGQPAIPFYASVSDVSIYDVSAEGGKLTVEIRELGHLCSTYTVVVDVNGTATEYTADFTTAGNFVVDGVAVKSGDSVTVTLKSADGQTVATQTLTVE